MHVTCALRRLPTKTAPCFPASRQRPFTYPFDGALFALGFDPDSIIDGGPDALLAAEISLCRLDRNVAQQELNLLQFSSRYVAQPRTSPAQVVRRQLVDGSFRSELADNVPDDLLGHALTPHPPCSVYATKHSARSKSSIFDPNVEYRFDPVRHRDRPDVTRLAQEVDDGPVLFSLLQMREVQFDGFMPPQAAGEQHRQKCAVTFALPSLDIRGLPQRLALFGG